MFWKSEKPARDSRPLRAFLDRDGRIRTGDPCNPIAVRYRAAPRPEDRETKRSRAGLEPTPGSHDEGRRHQARPGGSVEDGQASFSASKSFTMSRKTLTSRVIRNPAASTFSAVRRLISGPTRRTRGFTRSIMAPR